jgi:uncharacterized protein YndB with AHSA1/START domain
MSTTSVTTSIDIRQPVAVVFEYVTTPDNWPRWHPSSLAVSGAIDHALAVGEQVTEEYLVAGNHGRVVWTVTERDAPRRWVIQGRTDGTGVAGTVAYTLDETPEGTQFAREFVYGAAGVELPEAIAAEVRGRIAEESAEALRRLKAVLERGAAE